MLFAKFIWLGSYSCCTTVVILAPKGRLPFSVSHLSRTEAYLSLCFSVSALPPQLRYHTSHPDTPCVTSGHRVMISFHVELGFLAWLPHPLMDLLGDNPSRFPFCSLCTHGSFSFPSPFIIIGKGNFHVTWLGTWYVHLLCQAILLSSTSLTLIISSFP